MIGLAFTAPAFAIDHEFGGYWRTRMYTQKNFTGTESGAKDIALADTRTRLYYTAVINDNLKFVNKFEMDATWGVGGVSYGDIGADGIAVEVKNTYAEFKTDLGLFRVGTQAGVIHRGFVFDDDFSGILATTGTYTFVYAKSQENSDNMGDDVAAYHFKACYDLDTIKLSPAFTYLDLNGGNSGWILGLDLDAKISGLHFFIMAEN